MVSISLDAIEIQLWIRLNEMEMRSNLEVSALGVESRTEFRIAYLNCTVTLIRNP